MSRFAIMHAESVQGLASYLEERWLEAKLPAAEQWCAEMGALHVDEVLENVEDFAEALGLKPLEVKRLVGKPRAPRAPAEAARAICDAASDDAASTAPSAVVATPAEPSARPTGSANRFSALDHEAQTADDAASTAPSTATEQTSNGFRTVAGKKAKQAASDAASTCVSEVSTVNLTKPSLMKGVFEMSTFEIKAREVGALMGPKGATLSAIEKDTGAKVSVSKDGDKRVIAIKGATKQCVARAARLCKDRIAVGEFDRIDERASVDEAVHTVSMDSRDIGALLGKGGETLRKIEKATQARITVPKDDGAVRIITVRGSKAAVAAAKDAIAGAVSFVERTVEVPGWAVGEILGRGGKALEKLQQRTGVRVDISKEMDGEKNRVVQIRARTEDAAAAAVEAIEQIVRPIEHSIDVTSTEAGVLIGRKGETAKAIQRLSGARLDIEASGRMRKVWISGPTDDSIQKALDAMREALREDIPAERKTRTASPPRSAQRTEAPAMTAEDFPALR